MLDTQIGFIKDHEKGPLFPPKWWRVGEDRVILSCMAGRLVGTLGGVCCCLSFYVLFCLSFFLSLASVYPITVGGDGYCYT